jgi:hypothetical protein
MAVIENEAMSAFSTLTLLAAERPASQPMNIERLPSPQSCPDRTREDRLPEHRETEVDSGHLKVRVANVNINPAKMLT